MAKKVPPKLQAWIDARRRQHLSHAQIQMARELGMNPAKLGKIDNHDQESWKLPLPEFIAELYRRRFGRIEPEIVRSIEEQVRHEQARREARRSARQKRLGDTSEGMAPHADDDPLEVRSVVAGGSIGGSAD